jgi:hypothetical protein
LSPALRILNLSDCRNLDGEHWVKIVVALRKTLSTVKLDRCVSVSNKAIQFLIRKLRILDELSLMFCTQLTDQCLLPDDIRVDQQHETPPIIGGRNVMGGDLGQQAGALADLDLIVVQEQAEHHHGRLLRKYKSPWPLRSLQLRTLYLGGNMNMTEAAICFFVTRTPKLKTLSIPALLTVKDTTLIRIGKACPRLQHLNTSICHKVSTQGVIGLVRRCRNLRFLDFGGCEGLTDPALAHIRDQCPMLKSLDVSKTTQLSAHAILDLVTHLSNLTTLRLRAKDDEHRHPQNLFVDIAKVRPFLKVVKDY